MGIRLIVVLGVLALAPSAASAASIVDEPVAFTVRNTNTSQMPCASDGATYVVRGHLTGPRAALGRAVTLYYEGYDSGEWNWRFRRVPGYDYAAQLAGLGQVSVTVDQVGYGASGHPPGLLTCFGAQADIAHQIVQDLRAGTYEAPRPVAFRHVVMAGHDIGGAMAEIEAYSYHDVDALMVFTWQDQGQTPYIIQTAADAHARCAAGGDPADPGYVYFPQLADWPSLMPNTDPAVLAGAVASRLRNPCGFVAGTIPVVFMQGAPSQLDTGLAKIQGPVLLVLGALDPVFTADGFQQEGGRFAASRDVTSVLMADTGHFEMLGRTAPRFRALVAGWLAARHL